jgi:hypothetical protein
MSVEGGGAPKTGLRISFIILIVVCVFSIICYVYWRWSSTQAYEALLPRLGADTMVKGLRQYQRQTGQFPPNLAELEDRHIWNHPVRPDFGPIKSSVSAANYYYLYTKVSPLSFALWAIPSGPRREEATTHFMVVWLVGPGNGELPTVIRHWKGPALSKSDIQKLEPVPSNDVLQVMGMTEQPIIDQRQSKPGGSPMPLSASTSVK